MRMGNSVFQEDMEHICASDFIPWEQLADKTVLVTGGTGLIGFTLVHGLLYANKKRELGLTVLALVRDVSCAKERFGPQTMEDGAFRLMAGSVEEMPDIGNAVDYVIHGASQTASKGFVQRPVETIRTALRGTVNLLELARWKRSLGMVYLSSMEVYGHPERGHKVTEDEIGRLSPLDVRSSYPISKLQCENLCRAYAAEYGVPAIILRLAQTFGPGVKADDERIFAEFGRCVQEKRDIVLKTKGETERSYLYTADAATAILTVLLKGQAGMAYNAADESTYCSIRRMAEQVAAWGGVNVRYELQEESANGYPTALYMDLDTARLRGLRWKLGHNGKLGGNSHLTEMYRRMTAL